MSDLIERLKTMAVCVYVATDASVADDIADGLKKAIERIAELESEVARLRVDAERLDWHEQAMKVGHPSLPYWDDLGFFCYPYLVNGSPMGGGIGTVNCGQSLRAAIDAAKEQS